MKSRVIISLCLICFAYLSNAQNVNKIYRNIKKVNKSFLNYYDSTYSVKYIVFRRFEERSDTLSYNLVFFEKTLNSHYFKISGLGVEKIVINDTVITLNRNCDTVNVEYYNPTFHFYKDHPSSWFFSIRQFLTKKMGDFSNRKFSRPELLYFREDTIALKQQSKIYQDYYRIIYVNKDYRIIGYDNIDDDESEIVKKYVCRLNFFKHNCYDSLNRAHDLGTHTQRPFYKVPYSATYRYSGKDTFFIMDKPSIINKNEKYILLDYWYMGCKPCLLMMPQLQEIHHQIDTSKILMFGVNHMDNQNAIRNYFEKRGYDLWQLDLSKMEHWHKIESHPTILLLDSEMNIIQEFVGYSEDQMKDIFHTLESLKLLLEDE